GTMIENGTRAAGLSTIDRLDTGNFSIEAGLLPGGEVFIANRDAFFGASITSDLPVSERGAARAGQTRRKIVQADHSNDRITLWLTAVHTDVVTPLPIEDPAVRKRIESYTNVFDAEMEAGNAMLEMLYEVSQLRFDSRDSAFSTVREAIFTATQAFTRE